MNLFNKILKRSNPEDSTQEIPSDTSVQDEEKNGTSSPEITAEPAVKPKSEEVPSVHDYFEPTNYNEPLTYEQTTEQPEQNEHKDKTERKMMLLEPWEIVWSWVLMSIPLVGWIFSILWALGICRTRQKKHLARAFIIISLLTLVFYAIAYAFYTLVFRLELNDLPTVVIALYNWLWNFVASIFKK